MKDYQLKAIKALYLNLAAQAADAWDRVDEMTANNLRTGLALGLHADTLIGPVRLDFGVDARNRHMLSFSAGFDY